MSEKNPLGLKKIHHVEFFVGNAKQAEFYYRKAFGFSRAAYSGLETGNRETTSYLMRQNRVNFVLTTPLSPEHAAAEHIKQHGDGVRDIAFQVEDADHAFNESVKRGATAVTEPRDLSDENGRVRHAAIATYGDTIHSFYSYDSAERDLRTARMEIRNPQSAIRNPHTQVHSFQASSRRKSRAMRSGFNWSITSSEMSSLAR